MYRLAIAVLVVAMLGGIQAFCGQPDKNPAPAAVKGTLVRGQAVEGTVLGALLTTADGDVYPAGYVLLEGRTPPDLSPADKQILSILTAGIESAQRARALEKRFGSKPIGTTRDVRAWMTGLANGTGPLWMGAARKLEQASQLCAATKDKLVPGTKEAIDANMSRAQKALFDCYYNLFRNCIENPKDVSAAKAWAATLGEIDPNRRDQIQKELKEACASKGGNNGGDDAPINVRTGVRQKVIGPGSM